MLPYYPPYLMTYIKHHLSVMLKVTYLMALLYGAGEVVDRTYTPRALREVPYMHLPGDSLGVTHVRGHLVQRPSDLSPRCPGRPHGRSKPARGPPRGAPRGKPPCKPLMPLHSHVLRGGYGGYA